MARIPQDFEQNVFINCPFDIKYKPLFDSIVFAVQISGFKPRSAREASNAGEFRLQKIMTIISECKYGIHDLSRTELDKSTSLPRFNMPLELGIDLGCKRFGNKTQRSKTILVMDKSRYRYQKFISDIAGQDIEPHNGKPKEIIARVRDWLLTESQSTTMPGAAYMFDRYKVFQRELPKICKQRNKDINELAYSEFISIIRVWLEERAT